MTLQRLLKDNVTLSMKDGTITPTIQNEPVRYVFFDDLLKTVLPPIQDPDNPGNNIMPNHRPTETGEHYSWIPAHCIIELLLGFPFISYFEELDPTTESRASHIRWINRGAETWKTFRKSCLTTKPPTYPIEEVVNNYLDNMPNKYFPGPHGRKIHVSEYQRQDNIVTLPTSINLLKSGGYHITHPVTQTFKTIREALHARMDVKITPKRHPLEYALVTGNHTKAVEIMYKNIISHYQLNRAPISTTQSTLPPYVYRRGRKYQAQYGNTYLGMHSTPEEAVDALINWFKEENKTVPESLTKAVKDICPIKIPTITLYRFDQTDFNTRKEALEYAAEYYKDLKPELAERIEEYLEKHC